MKFNHDTEFDFHCRQEKTNITANVDSEINTLRKAYKQNVNSAVYVKHTALIMDSSYHSDNSKKSLLNVEL